MLTSANTAKINLSRKVRLDHVPAHARRPIDLTGLGDAFGATDPATGTSG